MRHVPVRIDAFGEQEFVVPRYLVVFSKFSFPLFMSRGTRWSSDALRKRKEMEKPLSIQGYYFHIVESDFSTLRLASGVLLLEIFDHKVTAITF